MLLSTFNTISYFDPYLTLHEGSHGLIRLELIFRTLSEALYAQTYANHLMAAANTAHISESRSL